MDGAKSYLKNYIKKTESEVLLQELRQKWFEVSENQHSHRSDHPYPKFLQRKKRIQKYTFPMGRRVIRGTKMTIPTKPQTEQRRRIRASQATGNFYSEMNRLEAMGYFERKSKEAITSIAQTDLTNKPMPDDDDDGNGNTEENSVADVENLIDELMENTHAFKKLSSDI
jgi:hypothetical protein